MNSIVADYLVQQLSDLAFTGRIAGLVRVVSMHQQNPNSLLGVNINKFPVSCNVSVRDCVSNKMHHLVPDSSLKSLIYFEDGGATPIGKSSRGMKFSGRMRLICWLNLNKLGQTSCNASVYPMAQVIKLLDEIKNANTAPITAMSVREIGIVEKSAAIFSKYTYREEKNQFLLYPYDYFALDLTVEYEIPFACINDDWINTEIECTDNTAS